MRFIGHLGSHLDASDPAGSAQKLATIFMAGLVAPATAAINQILLLISDPNLIPNLIQRGVAFAKALAQQLFWFAGPQVAATATDLVNAVTSVINMVTSRAWTAIPAAITTIATKASGVATVVSQMKDKTTTINVSSFGPVGSGLAQPGVNIGDLAAAVLNAISVATGGVGTQSTGMFGPTFSQFSAATVASALKHYADFIQGGFHELRHHPAGPVRPHRHPDRPALLRQPDQQTRVKAAPMMQPTTTIYASLPGVNPQASVMAIAIRNARRFLDGRSRPMTVPTFRDPPATTIVTGATGWFGRALLAALTDPPDRTTAARSAPW